MSFKCAWCSAGFSEAQASDAIAHARTCQGNPLAAQFERSRELLASARALADQRGVALAELRKQALDNPGGGWIMGKVDARLATATKAELDNEKMRALLRKIQWNGVSGYDDPACPSCNQPRGSGLLPEPPHKPNCELAQLLEAS